MMQTHRFLRSIVMIALIVAGCQPVDERQLASSVRRELERGHGYAQLWVSAADSSTDAAVSIGYLERLELGLGSPFRLIDYALSDPRLADSTRTHVAWALLARILDGDAYQIDPVALDRIGTLQSPVWPGIGKSHREYIEKAVREANDPRAGEEAVRMAYGIAAAENQVSTEAQVLAGRAAALVHDRIVARKDALALLDEASRTEQDALTLLRQWRRERRFALEQPRLVGLTAAQEKESVKRALDLVAALHDLNGRLAAGQRRRVGTDVEPVRTHLSQNAAQRLLTSAKELDQPPQTPVFIAARQLAREAASLPFLSAEEKRARERFNSVAYSEERYVAERALLQRASPYDAAIARADLFAAVSLRSYAQEEVWYPAMGGPGPRALQERFGLAEVTFDRTVPAHWRPYYRRMLARSLEDVVRVMPALDLRGLSVHFGNTSGNTQALAMHEPTPRRLVLPPTTAAGTIAHEVAHDIDWQVALRRYRVRGDYATDRATRSQQGAIASHMQDLRAATLMTNNPTATAHDRRPAEVFARGVDWYVAVTLAREGRVNGYLSSVQDELLTGYGTVRPPDVTGSAGDALMGVINELAPIYREQRVAFQRAYGSSRSLRAYDLVRQVVEAPPAGPQTPTTPATRLARVEVARDAALGSIDRWRCSSPLIPVDSELAAARRKITMAAVAARARGAALRDAELKFGREGRDWMIRKLYQGPWANPSQDALDEALTPLWEQVRVVTDAPPAQQKAGFDLVLLEQCSGA